MTAPTATQATTSAAANTTVNQLAIQGPRLLELDALRGIAALLVVLFHYTVRFGELYGHTAAPILRVPFGHYGVQLFFGISGFVIFMTLTKSRSILEFAVSRVSRLYPAYWASILITATAVAVAQLPGRTTDAATVIVNFTMWQDLLHFDHVDGVYWSLQCELIFYCIMGALFLLHLLKRIEYVLAAWLALSIASSISLAHYGQLWPGLVRNLGLLSFIPYFAIGVIAYQVSQRVRKPALHIAIAAGSICSASLLDIANGLVAAVVLAILGAVALGKLSWIASRPVVFLGTISYPLYLLHQNIGYVLLRFLEGAGVPTNTAIVVALIAVVCLASCVTFTIEKPALRRIRLFAREQLGVGRGPAFAPTERT